MQPLKGIRVLDLSKVLAGPICTQTLASLGAEVIKVENCDGGDETRHWAPLVGDTGAAFLSVNAGKRSLALNLKVPAAQKIVADLARKADILVQSFAPGVAEKLGVDRHTLAADNERLIYCSISGFGQSGPLSSLPGYDAVIQAFSGMMALNGEEGRPAVRLPASPIDQTTALFATQGILAALIERGRSGQGASVEVSLLETAIKLLGSTLQGYWATNKVPKRFGTGHPSVAPYQIFDTLDRPILLAIANDKFWRVFCRIAGLEEFVTDPRFRTNRDRVKNLSETIDLVSRKLVERTADDWLAQFSSAGIPAAPLNTVADLFNHEHVKGLNMLNEFEHPDMGTIATVAEPVLFDGGRAKPVGFPPSLGEHTATILMEELGYSQTQIEELKREQAVL